jgi:hypothetical protein
MELLIAILIALGFTVSDGASQEELKASDPTAYEQAVRIMDSGSYEKTDDGGIIIDQGGGD